MGSRDDAVGVATGYGMDGRGVGVRVPVGDKISLLSMLFRRVLGPIQPPIRWFSGTLFPRVKRPGREADYSPSTSVEVMNTWIYTSTPPITVTARSEA
jgi:hypothetical protein